MDRVINNARLFIIKVKELGDNKQLKPIYCRRYAFNSRFPLPCPGFLDPNSNPSIHLYTYSIMVEIFINGKGKKIRKEKINRKICLIKYVPIAYCENP